MARRVHQKPGSIHHGKSHQPHTFPKRSSLVDAGLGALSWIGAGRGGAGAGSGAPQPPKSSSGCTLGAADAPKPPPKPSLEVVAVGVGSPHPPVSNAGLLAVVAVAAGAEEPQSVGASHPKLPELATGLGDIAGCLGADTGAGAGEGSGVAHSFEEPHGSDGKSPSPFDEDVV